MSTFSLPVVGSSGAGRTGLEWLLYGHLTVPYWLAALVAGLAVTAGLVHYLRRLAED